MLLPAQRIGLAEAICAYTVGPAPVNHLDETGRVREGALADLVALDRDPFDGPAFDGSAQEIAGTQVRTWGRASIRSS